MTAGSPHALPPLPISDFTCAFRPSPPHSPSPHHPTGTAGHLVESSMAIKHSRTVNNEAWIDSRLGYNTASSPLAPSG